LEQDFLGWSATAKFRRVPEGVVWASSRSEPVREDDLKAERSRDAYVYNTFELYRSLQAISNATSIP
jgi:hypothetical protein